MKRFHVHVHVEDLTASIRFYSALFGTGPVVTKPDYAKWMLEDPRLNFALSTSGSLRGVGHLGLQVDAPEELEEIAARGRAAELGGVAQPQARCCYARADKHWFTDPQGVRWETFETFEALAEFGDNRVAAGGSEQPAETKRACCA